MTVKGLLSAFGAIAMAQGLAAQSVIQQPLVRPEIVIEGELEAVAWLRGCTGTLISQNVVLTAAHCVCPSDNSTAGCQSRMTTTLTNVALADNPTTMVDESRTRGDIRIGGNVIVHPRYGQAGWLRTDFAAIVLDQPAYSLADSVVTVPVARNSKAIRKDWKVLIAGRGTRGENCAQRPGHLFKNTVTVKDVVPDAIRVVDPTKGDAPTCPGDSGGPVFDQLGRLAGVLSWSGSDSTYRPVYEVLPWLDPIVENARQSIGSQRFRASSGTSRNLSSKRAPYAWSPETGLIGAAIASNNEVFSWYKNGTVKVGKSWNFDAEKRNYIFRPAAGKRPEDIVGIAIAGSNDRVFAWYRDGTVSAGKSWKLDDHRSAKPFSLPPRKTPEDIVGMAIAGSKDTVFAWYSDGTASAGTSTDLDAVRAPFPYTVPAPFAPTDIVGMAIAATDEVFAWYGQ